jgi:hypothetical protein
MNDQLINQNTKKLLVGIFATFLLSALTVAILPSIQLIQIEIKQAEAQTVTASRLALPKNQTSIGTANAVNKFVFDALNKEQASIIVTDAGGALGGEAMLIEVSSSPTSGFIRVDNVTLTSGQTRHAIHYSDSDRATQEDVNPLDFRYVNVTVPALGAGETSTIVVSGK